MIIQEEKVEIIDEKSNKNKTKKIKKPTIASTQEIKKGTKNIHTNTEKKKEEKNDSQLNNKETPQKNDKSKDSIPKEKKSPTKKIVKYISIFIIVLFVICVFIIGGFAIYNMKNNDKISKGISIYGIDVSNLTKDAAIAKVSEKFNTIENTEIKLSTKDYETTINPSEIELKYNIDSAVNIAFSIGKSGKLLKDNYTIFNTMVNGKDITPTYSLNNDTLTQILNETSKNLPNAVVESSYYVEDNELIITKGTEGYIVDAERTLADIKNSIKNFTFLNKTIELTLIKQQPKDVNLDKVYEEVHKDAKDAYYTKNPFVVYPSETGIDFKISLEDAKKELAEAESEYKIALKTVYPKVTTNDIGTEAFPDLLAEFSTKYVASNTNRTTNLRLAANKINGTVLLPDETFSYNKVVGARTISAGYKEAAIYQNGQVVDGLGGGICQISTTLFNAALFANLKIVEIHNHQFVPSYVGAGRDATVVYGSKDFKFKNSRKYAIKIKCSVSGGIANFKIYGVKEDTEYSVNVNASVSNGGSSIKSTTYRTLSLNGKQVSKEKIYSCTYKKH